MSERPKIELKIGYLYRVHHMMGMRPGNPGGEHGSIWECLRTGVWKNRAGYFVCQRVWVKKHPGSAHEAIFTPDGALAWAQEYYFDKEIAP